MSASESEEEEDYASSDDEMPNASLEDPRLLEFVSQAFVGPDPSEHLMAIDLLGEAFGDTELGGEELDEHVKSMLTCCFSTVFSWRNPVVVKKLAAFLRGVCASCSEARGGSARALLSKGIVKMVNGSEPMTPLAAASLLGWAFPQIRDQVPFCVKP